MAENTSSKWNGQRTRSAILLMAVLFAVSAVFPVMENRSHAGQPSEDPGSDPDTIAATIYLHGDFGGARQYLKVGRYGPSDLEIGDKELSSLKVTPGYRVLLFAGKNFRGLGKSFTADARWVGDDFNDMTSSIIVQRADEAIPSNFQELKDEPEIDEEQIEENEKNAINALKFYTTAQVMFQVKGHGKDPANTASGAKGYADNFRNLFYAADKDGKPLEFISEGMANAFAGPTAGVPVSTASDRTPANTATPYNGYLFLEPPGLDTATSFALVAYPVEFGVTGRRIFLVDNSGIVYEAILETIAGGIPEEGAMPKLLTEGDLQTRHWRKL